jgi:glycosyltransferase involved in cell wall biosynthesis
MRIGLITSQAFSLVNFRGPLIRHWVARGIEVHAFAPDYSEETRAAVHELGAKPVDFSMARASIQPLRDVRDFVGLIKLIRRLRPDATMAYFVKPVIYGTLAARIAGIRRRYVLIEGAGYLFCELPGGVSAKIRILRRIVTHMYGIALSGALKVFFLNSDDLDLFNELKLVSARQSVLLGGIGVELDRYVPVEHRPGPLTFLLAARLLVPKGVRDYVAAARRVRGQYANVRFVLLGSPDLNPASVTDKELMEWQSEGVVEWYPQVSDVRPWLSAASVFVLPSWYREGVPRSIQEAMASGLPIVTTDVPGCRDTVEDGVNGFLVPPHRPDLLAAALISFIEEPTLLASMGTASRRRAEAHFDAHEVNDRLSSHMGLA